MQALQHITVIGGGSWATALVKIFSESNIIVTWYLRSKEHVDFLLANGRNPNYLSFLQLNLQNIRPTYSMEDAISASGDILFAVPSAYLESETADLEDSILSGKNVYASIKGLVSEQLLIPSVYLSKRFDIPQKDITILSGPCHAEEIARDSKTFLTISGHNSTLVSRMATAITPAYIKIITNDDPVGVEYAAIIKNVIGLACGMVRGMSYGDNFQAVVVCNAMREVAEFLKALDDRPRDLFKSVYFGDLLVTAYSEFSRNRSFGQMIGRGYSVPMASDRMSMVAEGVPAVKGVLEMARSLDIHMPVVSAAYRMLYQHASPFTEFKLLEAQLQ